MPTPLRSLGPARGDHDRPRSRERPPRRGDRPAQRRRRARASDRLRKIDDLTRAGASVRSLDELADRSCRLINKALGAAGTSTASWRPTASPTIHPASSPSDRRSSAGSETHRPDLDPAFLRWRAGEGAYLGALEPGVVPAAELELGARGRRLGLCAHADPRRGRRGRRRRRVLRPRRRGAPSRPAGSRPRRLDRVDGARELPAARTALGRRRALPRAVRGHRATPCSSPCTTAPSSMRTSRPCDSSAQNGSGCSAGDPGRSPSTTCQQARSALARLQVGESFARRGDRVRVAMAADSRRSSRRHPVAGGGRAASPGPDPRSHGPATPGGRARRRRRRWR